jgi:hypothetical protein
MPTSPRFVPLGTIVFLLAACGAPQRQVKDWNDPRCFTYTDFITRTSSNNSTASALAILGGNIREAVNLSPYAPIHWIDGYSGDGKRVLVGYTDRQVVAGYMDTQGQHLSMSDLQKLGPVITKYSNLAQHDPVFQQKKIEATMLSRVNTDLGKSFVAAAVPQTCQ